MSNRIRELRRKHDMTMKHLGEQLGLAESTISQYETGKRNPDNEALLKLGEIFGVTVGYILGNDDSALPAEMYLNIGKRILQAAEANGQTAVEALSSLGVSPSTAKEMVAGQYPFTMDTLAQIAQQLEKPLEFFLTKETAPTLKGEHGISDDDLMFGLWGDSDDVDEEDLADVKRYAQFVRERKKDKGK